jgi:hypothetical protein
VCVMCVCGGGGGSKFEINNSGMRWVEEVAIVECSFMLVVWFEGFHLCIPDGGHSY